MRLPTGRVNARSGRVCMFNCANVHATFLSKAPYRQGCENQPKIWTGDAFKVNSSKR